MQDDQTVHPPKSSTHTEVEQLAYLEAYDAIVDKFYAFVAYKETRKDSGKWVIRIKSSVTAGTVFDPNNASLRDRLKKAGAKGEDSIIWGFQMTPKPGDPRLVENRVHCGDAGHPTHVVMHLVTRKEDGSPYSEKTAEFPWPEG